MSIQYIKGNLLESNCDYICHQVNCQGAMNSGIAKSIRTKWPSVFEEYYKWYKEKNPFVYGKNENCNNTMLGNILIVPINEMTSVINMASQNEYGYDGKRYTSYDAFWNCLHLIRNTIPKGSKIGFPCKIGSCRGGANWIIIRTMIEEVLSYDFDVYIYEYNGG